MRNPKTLKTLSRRNPKTLKKKTPKVEGARKPSLRHASPGPQAIPPSVVSPYPLSLSHQTPPLLLLFLCCWDFIWAIIQEDRFDNPSVDTIKIPFFFFKINMYVFFFFLTQIISCDCFDYIFCLNL